MDLFLVCGLGSLGQHCAAALKEFGENISNLFRFNHQTVLVSEYQIEAGDTLNGLLLAEVAYRDKVS